MRTDDVIERLTRDLRPVKPIRHPLRRGLEWLAGTTLFLAALVVTKAMVSGAPLAALPQHLVVSQLAAIAVSVTAAVAAFTMVVPGASRRVLVWPITATGVWLGGLLIGVFQEANAVIAQSSAPFEWPCVFMITLGSVLPVAGLRRLLRDGAPLAPRVTLALGVLAAAGLANIGACLSHPHTSSSVLLLWHGVTALTLVMGAALLGRNLLAWPRTKLS